MVGLTIGAICMLGGWLLAQRRDEKSGLPRKPFVRLGQWMALLGMGVAVLSLPPELAPATYTAALAVVLVYGLILVRGAGRLAIGWTSVAEIATACVGIGWTRPARVVWSVLAASGGLYLVTWWVEHGYAFPGLIGVATVLAPARWWLHDGRKREQTTTRIERALAGLHAGGAEWHKHESDQRGAPVRIHFNHVNNPLFVTYPLPPAWRSSGEEDLEDEVRARLAPWGYWLAHVNHGKRRVVTENVEPLPDMISYNGETATDTGDVALGRARLSRSAAKAKGQRYGTVTSFVWDARTAPHGLVVGTTGGGKSSIFRVIITTWCRNPEKRAILLDPKTTEFQLFRDRRNIMTVADSIESMTEVLRQVEAERRRRATLCQEHGVTAVWFLPRSKQPASWLVVIDEIMDYLDKSGGQSDQAKAENDLRAEALDLLIRGEQLARVGDIHYLIAGQRLDKKVVDGRVQNNSPLRILTSVAEAGSTERHMIGLQDVDPESATPGRGVARSVRLPESEVQFTFLNEGDLKQWLPANDAAAREWQALNAADTDPVDNEPQATSDIDDPDHYPPDKSTSNSDATQRDDSPANHKKNDEPTSNPDNLTTETDPELDPMQFFDPTTK